MLVFSLLCLISWQRARVAPSRHPSVTGRFQQTVGGLNHEWRFVFFLRHLGLYPVASTAAPNADSPDAARRLLEDSGSLRTEWAATVRVGDLGRVWLYMPDVWWRGSTRNPDVRPANALGFLVALGALFTSFWWIRQPLLGGILVALIGSDPFQIFEIFGRQNVFCWSITVAVVVLALHLPLLGPWPRSRRYLWAVPVVTGLLVATAQTVRPEPVAVLVSAVGSYLTLTSERWRTRIALVAVLLTSHLATYGAWKKFYEHKIEESTRVVAEAGGRPYLGPRYILDHQTWTALWEGLGDFDKKYGHQWNDWRAADAIRPLLRERYGIEVPGQSPTNKYATGAFWDEEGLYPKVAFDNYPHSQAALREAVLQHVLGDPLWFLGIVAKRSGRVLTETTPVQLLLGDRAIPLPMSGIAALLVLGVLVGARAFWKAKLVAFGLSLSILPLLVFSGLGATNSGLYHIIAAALLFGAPLAGGWAWLSRRICRGRAARLVKTASLRGTQ